MGGLCILFSCLFVHPLCLAAEQGVSNKHCLLTFLVKGSLSFL